MCVGGVCGGDPPVPRTKVDHSAYPGEGCRLIDDKGREENSSCSSGVDELSLRRGGMPTGPGSLIGTKCQAKGS